ncbi:hypothetical protein DESAMIL20_1472 [Desulfurella amilsii]|uniref:DUF4917 domain-containing protein n=1 Tax=Desulfurella amilsii TaxID=1562698 RepID=A0A1X4XWK5_9BACT|nr:DUF4917 family protein [Desulfurella amilsii]OSS41919.1 hypothetical protein DESAMIL20_1472 [Desulfurella amilsii]
MKTYQEIIDYLNSKKRQKHLLIGNGFSMAYNPSIFSYNALSRFVEKSKNDLLNELFTVIKNKNFELLMQQLNISKSIISALGGDKNLIDKIDEASLVLKESLIEAVKELHPEHVLKIPEEDSKKCAIFLKEYIEKEGKIFSTNYDLLLYWVLMRNKIPNAIDGFGRDVIDQGHPVPEDQIVSSGLQWGNNRINQNIFYLHGALLLFDTGIEIIKEKYDGVNYLLENIKHRIANKEYPIFVTAGSGKDKLNHIMHNKYLSFCYEALTKIEGSLITFGFNFGEYDEHIIEAINKAAKNGSQTGNKLLSTYIGVYSEKDKKHIESIETKFKCEVHIFDAKTVNIW